MKKFLKETKDLLVTIAIVLVMVAIYMIANRKLDVWPQSLVIVVSAFLGAIVTSLMTRSLLKRRSEIEEEKENNVQMYQNKLEAFSAFSKELWELADKDDFAPERIRTLLFNKVIFFLTKSDIAKFIGLFEDFRNNRIELYSQLTEVIKSCLDSGKTEKDCFDKEDVKKLWIVIDKHVDKENVPQQQQEESTSEANDAPIDNCEQELTSWEYRQAWHFAMWRNQQLDAIDKGIHELSLIEYDEGWRTNLLKQVRKEDVIFLFRRGGSGYIGAFKPIGRRIFERDANNQIIETIHRFDKGEEIIKDSAQVKADKEKYDIYGAMDDGATYCSNLIVEPIAYIRDGVGNPGGVYRRTISRYDTSYAKELLKRFEQHKKKD